MKTLYTERLILRLVSVNDAPFILELYNRQTSTVLSETNKFVPNMKRRVT